MVPMKGGYSVVFPDQWFNPQLPSNATVPWRAVSWHVPSVYECLNSELLAFCEGLSVARFLRLYCPRWSNRQWQLSIDLFSDNMTAVTLALQAQYLRPTDLETILAQPIVTRIVSLMWELHYLNCVLRFPWIPGHHHGVRPFVLADNLARAAAYSRRPWADGTLRGYTPVGPELQLQVMELARRHPELDAQGRKISNRGEIFQLSAEWWAWFRATFPSAG